MILPVIPCKFCIPLGLILAAFLLLTPGGQAQAMSASSQEPYTGEALCLPQADPSSDCLAYGPSAQLSDWAKVGLTYPVRPLPARHPAADLTTSPVYIAKLNQVVL